MLSPLSQTKPGRVIRAAHPRSYPGSSKPGTQLGILLSLGITEHIAGLTLTLESNKCVERF